MIHARNKILHVCHIDKFIPPFIDFIEENFDDFEKRHLFLISGNSDLYPYKQRNNIWGLHFDKKNRLKHLAALAKACQQADKIILHGLFNYEVTRLLALMPWVLPKSYWAIWGGDLYTYKLGERTRQWEKREFFRRIAIKRLGHIINYQKGDYELAVSWYGAKAKWHECFMYTSNLFHEPSVASGVHSGINILVGNSADPSNNHIDVLEKLAAYKDEDIHIYVPLSYGDKQHAETVALYGEQVFGVKFTAMHAFMKHEEYTDFLAQVDIAIFNHDRQQAMGTIRNLLGMGKKVYMKQHLTSALKLAQDGIKTFDFDEFDLECQFPEKDENQTRIKSIFTAKNLRMKLDLIFNEDAK
jgi:dTDP-N-acetylfucosamine:lipid II N-acetylfucosaminyltransferase